MAQFGFIGMGNMGYAMLNGVLGEFAPGQIIFTTPHKEKCEKISAQTGVKYAESNAECANNAKYIICLLYTSDITNSFKGVEKSFAIQAGREIRVMVVPEVVSDSDMVLMARDISKQIETQMEYPGQIKVSVIRESRAVGYAK